MNNFYKNYNIKILYDKPNKKGWFFSLIPNIGICYLKYNSIKYYYLCFTLLFWELNIELKIK